MDVFGACVYAYMCVCISAVPVSFFADYTDNAYSRLLKQPISIMRPIMTQIIKSRLWRIFWAKISF